MFNRDAYIQSPVEIEKELLFLLDKDRVKTVFDIGACEAEDSIRYSKLFPNSTVYAFEPRPDNILKGKESLQHYRCTQVVLENIALSDTNGKAEFYLSEGQPEGAKEAEDWDFGNKSSSLLPPSDEMKKHTEWLRFKNKIEVNTLRLEDYAREKSLSEIDFAHIDVQGAELMVLKGAGDFLKKIKLIWMEVEAVELYKGQPLKTEVEDFMQAKGFVNVLDTVNAVAGDQLYVNTDYFSSKKLNQLASLLKRINRRKKISAFFSRFK